MNKPKTLINKITLNNNIYSEQSIFNQEFFKEYPEGLVMRVDSGYFSNFMKFVDTDCKLAFLYTDKHPELV